MRLCKMRGPWAKTVRKRCRLCTGIFRLYLSDYIPCKSLYWILQLIYFLKRLLLRLAYMAIIGGFTFSSMPAHSTDVIVGYFIAAKVFLLSLSTTKKFIYRYKRMILIRYKLHRFTTADEFTTANLGYSHFVSANIALIFFTFIRNSHLYPSHYDLIENRNI